MRRRDFITLQVARRLRGRSWQAHKVRRKSLEGSPLCTISRVKILRPLSKDCARPDINTKTAQAIDLKMPEALLVRGR